MMLITKDIASKLTAADKAFVESNDGETPDEIIVKFFNPTGAQTWYIVQATPLGTINGEPDYETDTPADWHMFGFCDLGFAGCAELGYVLLSELQKIRGQFGLGIERDRNYSGSLKTVMNDYLRAA